MFMRTLCGQWEILYPYRHQTVYLVVGYNFYGTEWGNRRKMLIFSTR